jgi:hypothetical protein
MSTDKKSALEKIARNYNAALQSGKVKERRDAASEAHRLVFQAIKEIEAEAPLDTELLKHANEMFIDVRMGRPTVLPA